MRIVEQTIYKFEELNDKAKEKAREWFRSGAFDDLGWTDSTIGEAVREAGFMGIDITNNNDKRGPHIFWSGFSSQGDGACFEGTWRASNVKLEEVANGWGEGDSTTKIKRIAAVFAKIAAKYPKSSFSVKHRGHYSHENCTEFSFDSFPTGDSYEAWPEGKEDEYNKAIEELTEAAKAFMRWIYRQLEKDWEYQNSDQYVDENITSNEYEFYANGKCF